jgi:hypothetical protein
MNLKVTKNVKSFSVDIASNGFIMEYTGDNESGDWVEDKIVMPDMNTLVQHIKRVTELPRD